MLFKQAHDKGPAIQSVAEKNEKYGVFHYRTKYNRAEILPVCKILPQWLKLIPGANFKSVWDISLVI